MSERYRKFRLEWQEGDGGHLRWFIDDAFVFGIGDEALGRYTACGQSPTDDAFLCEHAPKRTMPAEPMSIVLNSALGSWNGGASATRGSLPGHLYVDHVRVWQRADRLNVGCDPPDHPTKEYIDAHPLLYGEPVLPRSEDACKPIYPPRARDAPLAPDGGDGGAARAPSARRAGEARGGAQARLIVSAVLVCAAVAAFVVGPRVVRAARGESAAARAASHYSSVVDGADAPDGGASIRAPMLLRPNGGGRRADAPR